MAVAKRKEQGVPTDNVVLVLGLDSVFPKNLLQFRGMHERGWSFTAIVADKSETSDRSFADLKGSSHRLVNVGGSLVTHLRTVRRELNRKPHHVELYACRRSLPLILPLLITQVPIVVVERGDLNYYASYHAIWRRLLKMLYRRADVIWFKEPYMGQILPHLSEAQLVFIPNPAPTVAGDLAESRDIDFLWANRLLPERQPIWFVEGLANLSQRGATGVMIGVRPRHLVRQDVINEQERCVSSCTPNLEILPWGETRELMDRARFFVLPGERVFGNNALLESMAHGVVPIVGESEGITSVVTHGVNGFIVRNDKNELVQAMAMAHQLPLSTWRTMSLAALQTVRDSFSESNFLDRLRNLYDSLDG